MAKDVKQGDILKFYDEETEYIILCLKNEYECTSKYCNRSSLLCDRRQIRARVLFVLGKAPSWFGYVYGRLPEDVELCSGMKEFEKMEVKDE